jgi:hypothetical protein
MQQSVAMLVLKLFKIGAQGISHVVLFEPFYEMCSSFMKGRKITLQFKDGIDWLRFLSIYAHIYPSWNLSKYQYHIL